ncbi:MAG: glycoside hydrolase family 97 N-terminal domain-containing protein, partial [Bacteroidales bacterium]|nr:glycoside hydrolase family 97 N-terminal domain-containing protein [Bacteroidales bacterium]
MRSYVAGLWILLLVLTAQRANAQSYAVASPDQSVSVRIEATDQLQYSVTFAGQPVIAESSLGFAFNGEPDLQKDLSVVRAVSSSRHDVWTPVVKSKHAKITDACNELVLVTEEKAGLRRRMDIVFRAYDDGVAFRYRLYRSGHIGNRQLTGELTTFHIPGNPAAWVVEYATPYASSYESEFKKKTLDDVTEKTVAGLPFLMKYSDTCWVAVTEAEIDN